MSRAAAISALAATVACAATASAAPTHTLTRAQAPAVATAINLRPSDLPKLRAEANPITALQRRFSAQLTSCLRGVPVRVAYAQAQSPSFVGSGASSVTISSTSEVMPSAALAARDLATVRGPRGVPCLRAQLAVQLKASLSKGDTLRIRAQRLPPALTAVANSFAYRFNIVVGITQGGKRASIPVSLHYDTIGFAYGQAEAGVDVLSTGSPPSRSLEATLAKTLLARARFALG